MSGKLKLGLMAACGVAASALAGGAQAGLVVGPAVIVTDIPQCCYDFGFGTESQAGWSVTATGTDADPMLSGGAETYLENGFLHSGGGFATLNVFYAVTGPSDIYVPVTVNGSVTAGGATDAEAEAEINWSNGGTDVELSGSSSYTVYGYAGPTYNLPGSGSVDVTYDVLTNTVLELSLFIDVNASAATTDAASAYGTVDPTLTLGGPYGGEGYSLVLSPNISAAAPEPSTWAIMLAGFAGLGAVLRRGRPAPRFA
jgi:hypothetical protein